MISCWESARGHGASRVSPTSYDDCVIGGAGSEPTARWRSKLLELKEFGCTIATPMAAKEHSAGMAPDVPLVLRPIFSVVAGTW